MDIVALTGEWLAPACDLFNRQTRGLPHCLPATKQEFYTALTGQPHYAHSPVRIGALDRGELVGFALGAVNVDPEPDGSLRVAKRGDGSLVGLYCRSLSAGEALLSEVRRHFGSVGARRTVAFDAGENHNQLSFFNGGFGACPEQLPLTPRVLAQNGFGIAYRELNLTCDLSSVSVDMDPDLSWDDKPFIARVSPQGGPLLAHWPARSPERMEVEVLEAGKKVASGAALILGCRQQNPLAGAVGYITWLGVEVSHQRRGIGRGLLSLMLDQMKRMGLSRVFLTTGSQNWRAQPLYLSVGFTVVGTSITMTGATGSP